VFIGADRRIDPPADEIAAVQRTVRREVPIDERLKSMRCKFTPMA
jgi:hypothetical protein